MNGPTSSTTSRATPAASAATVASRLRGILTRPEGGDVLDDLAGAGLVTLYHGLEIRKIAEPAADPDLVATLAGDTIAAAAGAIGRVDPRQPRLTLTGGRILGMYVQDCLISTEAQPAYHRLPSFPAYNPYHIVYLLGFGANQAHTVNVTLQVYSVGGSVRITTTGNPTAMVLGQSSVPITVPVTLRTTAEGFASLFIQRVGETGFDWFGVDVF